MINGVNNVLLQLYTTQDLTFKWRYLRNGKHHFNQVSPFEN